MPASLCTPLGACLVFRGVEGCIPFLHGSQGCSTYIRRYLISHFREPMDIASSNFHEESAIFGGSSNFQQGVLNVLRQYQPQLIGAATTCLAETIGEDMPRLLLDLKEKHGDRHRAHRDGVHRQLSRHAHGRFHSAVRELVEQLAEVSSGLPNGFRRKSAKSKKCENARRLPIARAFPGMVSAADLRHLKEILADFNLPFTLLPDYSETMDGATWSEYEKLQSGGTPIASIRALGSAQTSIEFGRTLATRKPAARCCKTNLPFRAGCSACRWASARATLFQCAGGNRRRRNTGQISARTRPARGQPD
jgi:nitrogenase molybdenum-iron protein NifN